MKPSGLRPLLAPTIYRKFSARAPPPPPLSRRRPRSSDHHPYSSGSSEARPTPTPNPTPNAHARWLSDLDSRIGKCISFGLEAGQVRAAGAVLQELARDWRELLVGSEGFVGGRAGGGLHRQQVVWGEMDSMGHVNNVTYIRYAESARVNWTTKFAVLDPAHKTEWRQLCTPGGLGLILGSIRCDYKFPIKFPDRVSVYHKLRSEPTAATDGFTLDVVVVSEQHRRPAARCVEEIVVYDYSMGGKAALPAFMLAQFGQRYRAQEAARARSGRRVEQLAERVRALEVGSWDRPDAVEDFGSAEGEGRGEGRGEALRGERH